MKQLSLILIGGGDRANSYLEYVNKNPDKFRLVGIAEPLKARREYLRDKFNVDDDMCFESYEQLLSLPKCADIAMICTQDKMHYKPAMMAIDKKYDLLLEKPMSVNAQECYDIYKNAEENGVKGLVCHVLRYTPYFKAIKKFISEGGLGDIMNISHTEGVGNLHYSHSYTRGNWRNEAESSPMLLAKCCHDVDILQWLTGEICTKVQSMGKLSYFREENKPEGAPKRCLDGCPHKDTCYYYAPNLYKEDAPANFRNAASKKLNPTQDELNEALKTSPYGRCVFQCDNDVVDHQIVNMQFGENKIATLTMSAFNKGGRVSTFMGTKGELRANMSNQTLDFFDFSTREFKRVFSPEDGILEESIVGGHGGDEGIMADLYDYIALGNPSPSVSDFKVSFMSHLVCFAAEEARAKGITVDMEEYIKKFR